MIEALRGQKLVVPDLVSLYSGWNVKLHEDYVRMRAELEKWLAR
jgi:hypothetical protein